MARKKSRAKVKKIVREKVETKFDCPFCNYSKCIECRLNRKEMTGELRCKVCGEFYKTTITDLSAPIDIYCDWQDECNKANE